MRWDDGWKDECKLAIGFAGLMAIAVLTLWRAGAIVLP
jgi:hypothetical protein